MGQVCRVTAFGAMNRLLQISWIKTSQQQGHVPSGYPERVETLLSKEEHWWIESDTNTAKDEKRIIRRIKRLEERFLYFEGSIILQRSGYERAKEKREKGSPLKAEPVFDQFFLAHFKELKEVIVWKQRKIRYQHLCPGFPRN